MNQNLIKGNLFKALILFSIPFMISSVLQTFYGLADLFIVGQFNGAATIAAVAMGSQFMHALTVVIVGLSMGITVLIGHSVGAGRRNEISKQVGNSILIFIAFALVVMAVLVLCTDGIITVFQTPPEAKTAARQYLFICFFGVPFITAYNMISSIFRGIGDSKSPMIVVAVSGLLNIVLDYILVGTFGLSAVGAAYATVFSQVFSVIFGYILLARKKVCPRITKEDLIPDKALIGSLLKIGGPVAIQEGIVECTFLFITIIANSRGYEVSAAVGIVEKIVGFMFLVPVSMLSSISVVAAQNAGANQHDRGRKALLYGIALTVGVGLVFIVICQFAGADIVSIFAKNEPETVRLGTQYLRAYVLDTALAGIHFCFSGYFSAYGRSGYVFIHNLISSVCIRVPGAYLASIWFPDTLFPMGLAAPVGAVVSSIICIFFYRKLQRDIQNGNIHIQS